MRSANLPQKSNKYSIKPKNQPKNKKKLKQQDIE
jgi:hypothetical protein